MAKTPPSEILNAIQAVRDVKDVVAKQFAAFEKLVTRIEQIEQRLKALEDGEGQGPRPTVPATRGRRASNLSASKISIGWGSTSTTSCSGMASGSRSAARWSLPPSRRSVLLLSLSVRSLAASGRS